MWLHSTYFRITRLNHFRFIEKEHTHICQRFSFHYFACKSDWHLHLSSDLIFLSDQCCQSLPVWATMYIHLNCISHFILVLVKEKPSVTEISIPYALNWTIQSCLNEHKCPPLTVKLVFINSITVHLNCSTKDSKLLGFFQTQHKPLGRVNLLPCTSLNLRKGEEYICLEIRCLIWKHVNKRWK